MKKNKLTVPFTTPGISLVLAANMLKGLMTKSLLVAAIFWLNIFPNGHAQGLVNEGSTITVQGAQFTVRENLTNNGTLINNGNLLISGAWINNGTYVPGVGLITFNGSLPQVINHNDQAFQRLTISGGGEKRFLANITIESELVLQDGNLLSENGARIIFQPGAVISGGTDQSHVVGPIEQQGAGTWLFPTGNGSTYLPVEISGIGDATSKAILQLHELISGESLTGAGNIAQLSTKRYWELNLTDGSLADSKLTLPLRGEDDFTGDASLFAIGESLNPLGPYADLGQSAFTGNALNGALTSESAPTLSFFTIVTLNGEENLIVYNGVSPNADGRNDFLKILNIERFPNNKVTIFNRWGDKVFEITGYDNDQRAFKGENNLKANEKISSGVYFYKIIPGDGTKELTGYLQLKN